MTQALKLSWASSGKVTEMFLLFAFTGLDFERDGSRAFRTERPWVGRNAI
jgi:hypothetical protein